MTRPDVEVTRDLLAKGWYFAKEAVGDFAPFVLGAIAIILPAANGGEKGSFLFGTVLLVVALACAENRGRDRGRAEKLSSSTINMSIRLADGYAIVREDEALIAAEGRDHG